MIRAQTRALQFSTGSRTLPNRFFRQDSLLSYMVWDLSQFALVRRDRREVIGLPDQIERPQRFPNLIARGIDSCDLGSCCHVLARLNEQIVNSA